MDAIKGGGAGGQKVNKTASTIQLRWNLEKSATFNDEEKKRLRAAFAAKLSSDGDIVIRSNEQRSQLQNREAAIARLNGWIAEALRPVAERVATKPTEGSKARRLDEKTRDAKKKQMRGKGFGDE